MHGLLYLCTLCLSSHNVRVPVMVSVPLHLLHEAIMCQAANPTANPLTSAAQHAELGADLYKLNSYHTTVVVYTLINIYLY